MTIFSLILFFVGVNELTISELKEKGIAEFYEKKFEQSIKTFEELEKKADPSNFKTYAQYALGHLYGKEKLELRKAIAHLKNALPYIRNKEEDFENHQLKIYYQLGEFYYATGKIDSSEYYLKEGFNLYLKHQDSFYFPTSFLQHLSNIFYRKHEYHMSQSVLDYADKQNEKSSLGILINNLSLSVLLDDSLAIKETFEKIEQLNVRTSGNQFYHLGIHAFNHRDYKKAIENFLLFIDFFDTYLKEVDDFFYSYDELLFRNYYLARTYLKLSECSEHLNNKEQQLIYLLKALDCYQSGRILPHQDISTVGIHIYRSLADFYYEDNDKRDDYLLSAEDILKKEILYQGDTNEIMRYELMLQNHYKAKNKENSEEKDFYYWKSYQHFHEFIWQQYKDADQLYHFKELDDIQNTWIDFYVSAYQNQSDEKYLIKALEIIESTKANVLKKRGIGVGDPNFKDYLKGDDLISSKSLPKSQIQILLSEKFKKYFQKETLDYAFISYYVANGKLYIITYYDEKFYLDIKEKNNRSVETILSYINKSDYFIDRDFQSNLRKLSNYLLPNYLDKINCKRLVISAHDRVSEIPFEILKNNDRYMVEDFAITYSFSLHNNIFLERKTSKKEELHTLAIAPFINSDLIFSKYEVEGITNFILKDKEATKENVKRELLNEKYNVIHFASHSFFEENPDQSYIQLTSQSDSVSKITFEDISKINVPHVELAVLNSCKSAVGVYKKGEGDISLQKAFAYAQIPTVIASKWDVNDQVSASIMTSFYKYLGKGWEKDLALQFAKIDFLNENQQLYNNPMFWGSLVLKGNNEAIVTPSFSTELQKLFY